MISDEGVQTSTEAIWQWDANNLLELIFSSCFHCDSFGTGWRHSDRNKRCLLPAWYLRKKSMAHCMEWKRYGLLEPKSSLYFRARPFYFSSTSTETAWNFKDSLGKASIVATFSKMYLDMLTTAWNAKKVTPASQTKKVIHVLFEFSFL